MEIINSRYNKQYLLSSTYYIDVGDAGYPPDQDLEPPLVGEMESNYYQASHWSPHQLKTRLSSTGATSTHCHLDPEMVSNQQRLVSCCHFHWMLDLIVVVFLRALFCDHHYSGLRQQQPSVVMDLPWSIWTACHHSAPLPA